MRINSSQLPLSPLTTSSLVHILIPNLPYSFDATDHVTPSKRAHHAGIPTPSHRNHQ